MSPRTNPLVLCAVIAEFGHLLDFLGIPGLRTLLGGDWPSTEDWVVAAPVAVPAVLVAVGLAKHAAARRRRG
jgi:hypothetical protein